MLGSNLHWGRYSVHHVAFVVREKRGLNYAPVEEIGRRRSHLTIAAR